MRVPRTVFDDAVQLGRAAATVVAERIARADDRFLLGCPGGRSPRSTYQALAALAGARELDLSRVVIVMMDDYVVEAADGFRREDPAALHSCERFAREEIVGPLNASVAPELRIPEDGVWFPDPADPAAYDERIAAAGGIDLFLLASGASDGHVAFNPPGAPRESRTRVVPLPDSTRRDNLATFPSFGGDLEQVPRHGVTVGVDTIAALSASVLMLAHGEDKGLATRRLIGAVEYEPDWPATIVSECRDPRLFIDRAAQTAAVRH